MTKERVLESDLKRRSEQNTTLRCLNCFNRLKIELGTARITCDCGTEFMIGWRGKGKRQAKILGVPIPGKHT
jgi:DNA-directed RNA polymerase subunit RPC12/RpoP